MEEKYILTKIKLNNFYGIYNTKDIIYGKMIKEIFNHTEIYNETFKFDTYKEILYNELVDILYDCLHLQLRILYRYLFKKDENNLEIIYKELPDDVLHVIEKMIIVDDIKLKNVIEIKDRKNPIMYYLSWYCASLQDILEMFFETEKYISTRKKFLEREEGKENKIILEKYCNVRS